MNNSKVGTFFVGFMAIIASCADAQASGSALQVVPAPYTGTNTGISQATLFGGEGNDHGYFTFCRPDGACTLIGDTIRSFGDSMDYLAIQLDTAGKPTWAQTYGGSGNDLLMDAIVSQDGGVLLVGDSGSQFLDLLTYVNGRALILKLDRDGRPEWMKLMQNAKPLTDTSVTRFYAATQTTDGGFIAVGAYISPPVVKDDYWPQDMVALKLSHDGQPVWLHRYHFAHTSFATAVFMEPDGRIRIAGSEDSGDNVHSSPMLLTLAADGMPTQAIEYAYDGALKLESLGEQSDGKLMLSGVIVEDKRPPIGRAAYLWLNQDGTFQGGHVYSTERGFVARRTEYFHGTTALVGNTGTASNVVRDPKDPEHDAVALMLDAQGNVKIAAKLGTQHRNPHGLGDTEFWDIAPLDDHRYRLIGSTDAFGSGYATILTTVWAPAASSSAFVQVAPLEVKVLTLALPTVSGDISGVRDISPQRLDIKQIKVGSGNQ